MFVEDNFHFFGIINGTLFPNDMEHVYPVFRFSLGIVSKRPYTASETHFLFSTPLSLEPALLKMK